jgi:hypothetical protein
MTIKRVSANRRTGRKTTQSHAEKKAAIQRDNKAGEELQKAEPEKDYANAQPQQVMP